MLALKIVSPTGIVFESDCDFVVLPASVGQLGILTNHAPLLSTLKKGRITARQRGSARTFDVPGGFVEVLKNRVTVLTS